MEYKCTKCGHVMETKENNCPECGEKLHYCSHKGCDKQLFDANQKYCAFHTTKRNETAKKVVKGVLIGVGVAATVPLIIISAGKVNPIKLLKK